jgi:nucleotidyltransferase/DNA polymerase involved in DNA repair
VRQRPIDGFILSVERERWLNRARRSGDPRRADLHRRGLRRRRGLTHLFGTPAEIASAVRRRVRAELGLPISIGVARTKHLAKIDSQVAKPDGLLVVDPGTELNFLHDLPVELMWGVGPATRARLAEIDVHTIGQLARMPGWSLERVLGRAAGEKLMPRYRAVLSEIRLLTGRDQTREIRTTESIRPEVRLSCRKNFARFGERHCSETVPV